jgi:CTD nuclear envelope phosphatase 1
MFFFSGWLTALLYAVGGWLHRVSQRMRSLGVLRPLPMMAFVRARHLLNWIRDRLLSPGFKPLLLGLASAQVLGGVSYDLSEWLARLMLERLAQVVTQGRMDSATLVESIQFGGLLPRFSKLSCGSYLAYASRPSERKILVLDLDETLVHSSFKDSAGCDLSVEVDVDDVPTVFFVRKRPHLELFIRIARQWYDLVIFTASLRRYADPLIDALDPTGSLFCARYFRDDCVRLPPYNFVKNLSTVSPNLGKVIIVDNSPASYAMHAANALPIDAWYDDPFDEELLNLLPVLRSLSILEDVRSVLGLRLTRGSLMSRYRPLVAT